MKYYRVKKEFDNKIVSNITTKRIITTLLKNELYTEKEMTKKGLIVYASCFEIVEISKQKTCFVFGSRREVFKPTKTRKN